QKIEPLIDEHLTARKNIIDDKVAITLVNDRVLTVRGDERMDRPRRRWEIIHRLLSLFCNVPDLHAVIAASCNDLLRIGGQCCRQRFDSVYSKKDGKRFAVQHTDRRVILSKNIFSIRTEA